MNLGEDLENTAKTQGADFFGVADLSQSHDFILDQGGEHIAAFPRAISIGNRLLDAIVNELFRHEEPSAIYTYRGLYNSVNNSLDRISLTIAKKIQESNFNAYQIPASQITLTNTLNCNFPWHTGMNSILTPS